MDRNSHKRRTRINTATDTQIAGFINAGSGPIGVVATTTRVYVANFGDGTVTVLDAATNTFVDLVVVGSGPFGMALSPDGTRLYVANSGSNTVSAINTATNSVVGTPITAGNTPNGVAVSPDGTELWVVESTPGRLVRFAIKGDGTAGPREVVAELPGTVPDGLAFATDGSAVIACYRPDIVFRWRPDGPPELLAADPEGTAIAAPTNAAFFGPDLASIAVPNIGRWHVTTFQVDGLRGVPLWYPAAADLGY